MSRVVVTRAIPAATSEIWEVFTDLAGRGSWLSEVESVEILTPGPFRPGMRWRETRTDTDGESITEELVVTAADPPRSCTMALVGQAANNRLTYVFSPIEVGPHRGETSVSAIVEGPPVHGLTNQLLGFLLGGLAARTVEGALRDDLDALAGAWRSRACEAA